MRLLPSAWCRRWLAPWLLVPRLAGAASAQLAPPAAPSAPLSLASDPAVLARTALGAERGTLVVGVLRGDKAAYGIAHNPEPLVARAIAPASGSGLWAMP